MTSKHLQEDTFTKLMFTLPAELRNEIYSLALPAIRPHIPISRPYPQLKWLASSKELFADAAVMFYASSCFYHNSRLLHSFGDKTLVQHLNHHVRGTYPSLDHNWGMTAAGSLINELVLDLRMSYEQVELLPDRLRWTLDGFAARFPNLKKLYIFFGPDFMAADIGAVPVRKNFKRLQHNWMAPEEYAGGGHFSQAVAVVDEPSPKSCEIRWRISGYFNVIDVGVPVNPMSVYRDTIVRF